MASAPSRLTRFCAGRKRLRVHWPACSAWRNFVAFTMTHRVGKRIIRNRCLIIVYMLSWLHEYTKIDNATRFCHLNGTWDHYSNYDRCSHVSNSSRVLNFEPVVELPTIIYYAGYALSLVALSLAVAVFMYFKWVLKVVRQLRKHFIWKSIRFYRDLRCLRNTIHANLFITYILAAFLWILTLSLQV